jgi:cystathionine gamma-lyase
LEVTTMDFALQEMILMHDFEDRSRHYGAVAPPVYLNSLHVFPSFEEYAHADTLEDDCFVYGRSGNPTTHLLERKLAALEGGEMAAVFASGMAAVTSAILGTCKAGDHIVCMRDAYQPVKRFMAAVGGPRLNVGISFVTGTDLNEVERAIQPNTRLMILESPATFVFTVVDLKAIAEICRRHGVFTYIDNTYSTPLFQNPLEFGIDLVMHTLSKYLGGHSDLIGGALIAKDAELMGYIIKNMREWLGGVLGPMEGWLVLRGMRSLEARLRCHQENAMKVATWLESQPQVARVLYTGLDSHPQRELIQRQMRGHTGLMSLVLDRPPEAAVRFINKLKLFGKGCSRAGLRAWRSALCTRRPRRRSGSWATRTAG